ncbi:putative Alpha and gamma adaptin binding protein p34 [Monocercomonoides exilis]|uniref:putative Alpha and gamma adaptin binding protein p34 n=1 Tax=Monocercomonoides exilis TaxID=2049356 RepID=UPI00355A3A01|nr:putative Alpha and gamma adaptin binding protein p34 [Monocercomonoides exilis]|eukprot:MONOS_628.1-p1 / transcript=MONOS_628.1 / gene=MONOS_628 / organism=Monocercomonoides_exilis_PA203 / gene_product=unspecified product / transcript_product=unspecified product / location=Mono_scaffold00010:86688-88591(+) / protein_length=413 / sequence_SO=supercontig / SO=protein_coding / is_pseudo=false
MFNLKNDVFLIGENFSGRSKVLKALTKDDKLLSFPKGSLNVDNAYYSAIVECSIHNISELNPHTTSPQGFVLCFDLNKFISSIREDGDPELVLVVGVYRPETDERCFESPKSNEEESISLEREQWCREHFSDYIECDFRKKCETPKKEETSIKNSEEKDSKKSSIFYEKEGVDRIYEAIECYQWPISQMKERKGRHRSKLVEGDISSSASPSSSSSTTNTTNSKGSSSSCCCPSSSAPSLSSSSNSSSVTPKTSSSQSQSESIHSATDALLSMPQTSSSCSSASASSTSSDSSSSSFSEDSKKDSTSSSSAPPEDESKESIEKMLEKWVSMGKFGLAQEITSEMKLKDLLDPLYTIDGLMSQMSVIKAYSSTLSGTARQDFAAKVSILMEMLINEVDDNEEEEKEEESSEKKE